VTAASPLGQVITFYSYKGGTGRSMSLANVACLLAERLAGEGGVLLVDWDLEAPGLHRFFPGRLTPAATDTPLGLDHRIGLIDLFQELDAATPATPPESDDEAEARAAAALDRVELERFVGESGISGIRLLRAGRDDDGRYSQRVTTFSWEGLFRRSPVLFRGLAERWSRAYRYVLLDSRTGVGDIAGICTALLPEKLVVVFTPNRQSLTGIRALVERATSYRRQSDDLRPLVVFPLPSRIEAARDDLRTQWRMGNRERGITGYQPMFEDLLAKTYGLPDCKLDAYFEQVQIQQTPDYAYGEVIAVRAEQASDRLSISSSFRVFTDWLVNAPGPWRRQSDVDTLIETLKERVGADESIAQEQRRGLEELVGKLEETVKREGTTVLAQVPAAAASGSGPPGPKHDVFLSYAAPDLQYARRLAAELERHGLSVWWDRTANPKRSLDDTIGEALDASRVVVAIWSQASAESAWVQSEAEEGRRRRALLSVSVDDARIPLQFRHLDAIDLRRWARTGTPADLDPLLRSLRAYSAGPTAQDTEPPEQSQASPPRPVGAAPPRRLRWRPAAVALAILVVLGACAAIWLSPSSTTIPVPGQTARPPSQTESATPPAASPVVAPTLVGQSLEQAVVALTNAGLKIGRTETLIVTDARPGTVLRQSPTPGDSVRPGTSVDLVVAAPGRKQQRTPQQYRQ